MNDIKANILYFAPCRLDEGVGGGTRFRNMIDVLAQLGTKIHIISYLPADKFNITNEQINDHLYLTSIFVRKSFPRFLKALAMISILLCGMKHIRKSDILFAHETGIVSGFPAFILAKIFGKPLIIDHIDIKFSDTPGFIYKLVLKRSNVVFTISRYLEEEVKEIGCRNVIYIPIFIDTDRFQKDALQRLKTRENLGLNDKEILIGYAGSFWHVEGVPFLLKAFRSLCNKYNNIKLVLLGGSNVHGSDNMSRLISDLKLEKRAIIIKQQPYTLMPKYLSAFDIACSPKIDTVVNRAATPVKIYEYMAMGLPAVVSSVGEISKVIENGVDGFLIKPGDEYELEKSLELIINNPDLAKKVGEKAKEKIINYYTQQAMIEKIGATLNQILENRSHSK